MRTHLSAAIVGAVLLASGLPVFAHHSGAAEFDSNKKIDLTGVVTKVEWTNPHAHFYMDVTDASGKVANWNLELASPNVLIRNGWTRNSIKPGDKVSVTGIESQGQLQLWHCEDDYFSRRTQIEFLVAGMSLRNDAAKE